MKFEEKTNIKILKNELFGKMIYFLIKDNNVVYVGQTINGVNRPIKHTNKNFDYFTFISVQNKKDLDVLERFYILKYKPKYNKTIPILKNEISFSTFYIKFYKNKKINNYKKTKEFIIKHKLYSCNFRNQMFIEKNIINYINDLI